MGLIRQLDQEEWDILSIVTDPILLGEFLRNTADGSSNRDEWPKQKFNYRWYQKDILTDTSEFIALTAGRSVGKCNPVISRIYTYPYGYISIRDALTITRRTGMPIIAYSMNEKQELAQKRIRITSNGWRDVFRITTISGHAFDGTANHPILTPRGWIMLSDLADDDQIAVMTFLPHESMKTSLTWQELRWLGYIFGDNRISPEMGVHMRYTSAVQELKQIAYYFDARLLHNHDGSYSLMRKRGPLKHYFTRFIQDHHLKNIGMGFTRVPIDLKSESLDQIRLFLEAYLSNWADFTTTTVRCVQKFRNAARDIQELLLRFDIESTLRQLDDGQWEITVDTYWGYYNIFKSFDIPGVSATNLRAPSRLPQPTDFMRFEDIADIQFIANMPTYAITVQDTPNYISDNILVHNSLVLEDKMIFQSVNVEDEFPATKESLLVTPNLSQMTPILDRLILRLTSSPVLRDFLKGNVNRSKGTLDFPLSGGSNYRMNARIAGSTGQSNLVGLHIPKIIGDEQQIMPMSAFIQMGPAYNSWEPNSQQIFCGCPNGLREGNVLYMVDQRMPKFKKYRIPAHQNPFYSYDDDRENLLKYGGETSDDYVHLVLGQHGDPAFSIIPRDKVITEPFDFYTYRYSQTDKHNGKSFKTVLGLHKLPQSKANRLIFAIDTGFADPTVMQIIGQDNQGTWRTFARYRLSRIAFPEQADIIDWIDSFYNFGIICIDLGSGGGGIGVTQDLQSSRFSRSKQYDKRIHGVRFGDYIDGGQTSAGIALRIQAKSFAGQELARLITDGHLIFSELDMEGVSQMERVAYQRKGDGTNQYFILSERGTGKSQDDHIFASYIVFILTLLTGMFTQPKKKLIRPRWL